VFPLEKLLAVKKIVTHENCPDGTASAILLHDVLPDAEIVFMQYQTAAHKELNPEPGMLFADFSPFEGRNQEFVEAGALVLDHHKTAKPVVEAFGKNGIFGDEADEPGVCGAVLALRHVWLPMKEAQQNHRFSSVMPTFGMEDENGLRAEFEGLTSRAAAFATLAGVRDTWQNKSPDWRKACVQAEMLRFYPPENWLEVFNPFRYENNPFWAERMKLGKLIVEKHEVAVKKSIEKAYRFTTAKGTRVIMLSNTHTTSDAAEVLDSEADLVVGFGYEVDKGTPKAYFSTRSRGNFDCGAFCKSLGGGGHTKAAGFNFPLEIGATTEPYSLFAQLLGVWERSLEAKV
jgi:hypothetical protein